MDRHTGTGVQGASDRRREALLLGAGLAAGALLAYVLAASFDQANRFALRLQAAALGTTEVSALSIGLVVAFASGLTMIFTPCGMPLVFTLNSLAAEGRERARSWGVPLALFTVGIAGVMAAWGLVVGAAGGGIVRFLAAPSRRFAVTEVLYSALGAFGLLMALWEFGWVRLPRIGARRVMPVRIASLGPYPRALAIGAALGGGFGVGCPFPTYQAVLAWAAVVGDPFYGAAVLAANALGRAAPLALLGWLVHRGAEQRTISRWLSANARRARFVSGTGLAIFAGLMLALWGFLVPFLLRPSG